MAFSVTARSLLDRPTREYTHDIGASALCWMNIAVSTLFIRWSFAAHERCALGLNALQADAAV
jgi:hypothetical protein